MESEIRWNSDPVISSFLCTPTNLPYAHYSLIFLNDNGEPQVVESSSIQDHHTTVFTPEVRDRFLEIIGVKTGYKNHSIDSLNLATPSYDCLEKASYHLRKKRRRANTKDFVPVMPTSGSELPSSLPGAEDDRIGLKISETDRLKQYYADSLKYFKQVNCRVILKAFIKFIEPCKQTKHPYNGGNPKDCNTKGDPEKTKPEWWPRDIRHREPDHLSKPERIGLIVHIMCKLGRSDITADRLLEIAYSCKLNLKDPEKFAIIEEILNVRKIEEKYEHRAIDPSTVLLVVDRTLPSNGKKNTDSVTKLKPRSQPKKLRELKKADLNPSPSGAQESPFSAKPNDMSVPTTVEDRNQFDESERPDRLCVTPSNNYYSHYSNTFIEAPTTQGLSTPAEQTSINCLAQATFPDASSAEYCLTAAPSQNFVSQYAPWTPSFRGTYSISQDYRSTASHGMSENLMHYPVGIIPNSDSVAQPPTPGCWVVPALPTQPGANQGWGY
ncbi:kinesin [Aspergillus welwitschiae]|uniref:Kinesin n=1 Tax=Aspergillus welwitschiae TaxID=1341132 RepID=A0A3F3PJ76_9EURO|nr:kinesin [Aspergillus welwitschiae]RDH26985.1 kinesin [Aspergillus welwitschiae]